jgi:Rrf2 family protein
MSSLRGPHGGVALARPANQITLMDIVTAIDGSDLFTQCVLGLPGCGAEKPCPLHRAWAIERARLAKLFEGTTLDSMVDDLEAFDLRLAVLSG